MAEPPDPAADGRDPDSAAALSEPRFGMRRLGLVRCVILTAASMAFVGCGASGAGPVSVASAANVARWSAAAHISRVLDLTSPRGDGSIVVAAAGRLELLPAAGAAQPFATGPTGYANPGGEEPYIALSSGLGGRGSGCSFGRDTLYVLRLSQGPGVTAVDSRGHARRFASLPAGALESGIALDETGRFAHRLLVTSTAGGKTAVYAIDCHGRVSTITRSAPRVEGGIAVAPATFGRFAGDLVAGDEYSGRIYAIAADGSSHTLADSGLPHGPDTGVETAGFLPPGFGAGWSALLADRLTPGNPHPGDDLVLRLGSRTLKAAGVRPGDLLIASEGGARTDAVSCAASCRVRHVADGPAIAHAEGHIVFRPGR
jgi:hypothetical protein